MAEEKPQPTDQDPAKDKDAEILVGGPGQDAPVEEPKPATPTGVEMTIAGQKRMVDPDIAAWIEERERQTERKISQMGTEVGRLRQLENQIASLNKAQTTQAQPNFDTLIFENPSEAKRLMKEEVKQEIRAEYSAAENEKEFWREFYKRHKDLDEDDFLVKSIASKNIQLISTLREDPLAMQDKIADLSRREILRIANRAKSDTPDKTRAVVEGKSIEAPKPTPRPETEEKGSLSQVIRERRKARHEAALSKGGK